MSDFELPPPRRRRDRKNAAKRVGAREIVGRLAWTDGILVFRAPGEVKASDQNAEKTCRATLASALAKRSPGIWAAAWPAGRLETKQVTDRSLSASSVALTESKRYPRALSRLVGDVERWRDHALRTLQHSRQALGAANAAVTEPSSLLLEALCLWIGPDEGRPSRHVLTEQLQTVVNDPQASRSIAEIAAIVLGQRGMPGGPQRFAAWREIGALLPTWPTDVLCLLMRRAGGPDRLRPVLAAGGVSSFVALDQGVLECLLSPEETEFTTALAHADAIQSLWSGFTAQWARRLERTRETHRDLLLRSGYRCSTEPHDGFYRYADSVRGFQYAERVKLYLTDHLDDFLLADVIRQFAAPEPSIELHNAQRLSLLHMGFSVSVGGPRLIESVNRICDDLVRAVTKAQRPAPNTTRTAFVQALLQLAGRPEACWSSISDWAATCSDGPFPGEANDLHIRLFIVGLRMILEPDDHAHATAVQLLLRHHGALLLGVSIQEALASDTESLVDPEKWLRQLARLIDVLSRAIAAGLPIEYLEGLHPNLLADLEFLRPLPFPCLQAYVAWAQDHNQPPPRKEGRPSRERSRSVSPWARAFSLPNLGLGTRLVQWCERRPFCREARTDLLRSMLHHLFIRDSRMTDEVKVEHVAFLAAHPYVLEWLGAYLDRLADRIPESKTRSDFELRNCVEDRLLLIELAAVLHQAGHDPVPFIRLLLNDFTRRDSRCNWDDEESWPEHFAYHEFELLVSMAGGDPDLLAALVLTPRPAAYNDLWETRDAWRWLCHVDGVPDAIRPLLRERNSRSRIIRWLGRLRTASRLPDSSTLAQTLRDLVIPSNGTEPVASLGDFDKDQITDAARLLSLLKRRTLPASLQKIINRPQHLRRELEALRHIERGTPSQQARRHRLEHILNDQPALHAWIRRDLAKNLGKAIGNALLQNFEQVVNDTILSHFQELMGTCIPDDGCQADWENALWLYYTITANRRPLRKLLGREICGDRAWLAKHPTNARFLAALRSIGVATDVWLSSLSIEERVGDETWRISLEDDPLKILQMGNYFGTCLGRGEMNDFSVVANAIEADKRVIYVRDDHDRVIGRKLILMLPIGTIVGFYSYGSASYDDCEVGGRRGSPWMKIVLDRFCRQVAERCNARLCNRSEEVNIDSKRGLFAKWYCDTMEGFDTLITEFDGGIDPTDATASSDEQQRLVLRLVESRVEDEELVRTLLSLGDDAAPVAIALEATRGLDDGFWRAIACYSHSASLTQLARSKCAANSEAVS